MIIAKNREDIEYVIDNVVSTIKKEDLSLSSAKELIEKEYFKVRKNISWKSFLELVNFGLFFGGIA